MSESSYYGPMDKPGFGALSLMHSEAIQLTFQHPEVPAYQVLEAIRSALRAMGWTDKQLDNLECDSIKRILERAREAASPQAQPRAA